MRLNIWDRYILKHLLKTFFLFVLSFYGVYILIDYAHHTASFHQHQDRFSWQSFCTYYLCEFAIRSEMLIPVAVLLGALKTLCKLNYDNELIAMLASGVHLKRLMKPLIAFGYVFTLMLYLNAEYVMPQASKHLKYIEDARASKKNNSQDKSFVHAIPLEGSTQLLFRKYDSAQKRFIDLFWVRSPDAIVKIEQLDASQLPVKGYDVTYLKRSPMGELVVRKHVLQETLPNLKLNEKSVLEKIVPPEALSLTALWKELPHKANAESEKEAKLLSTFHRKIAFPWLCLLAVLSVIPSCVAFSRQFSPFMIYATSLFALIGIYIVIDAGYILSKRQLLDPLIAIWSPIALAFIGAFFRYYKL